MKEKIRGTSLQLSLKGSNENWTNGKQKGGSIKGGVAASFGSLWADNFGRFGSFLGHLYSFFYMLSSYMQEEEE